MAVRHGPDELQVKEQQVEGWEEKLARRAQALADSARSLQQRRANLSPLVSQLKSAGGALPGHAQELLSAEPLVAGPHVEAALHQAHEARRVALDARIRAAQAWEEDLTRQTTALNTVLQGLTELQQQLQAELEAAVQQRAAAAQAKAESEAVMLVRAKSAPTPSAAPRPPPAPRGGPDNRVHSRARLRVQVDFESDHNFFTGFSSDISEGGLFVATVNIQPLGSPVEVAFALPTGEQVMARGTVRWVRENNDRDPSVQPGMGIQFEALSEDAREAVHSFIAQREPMFFPD